MRIEQHIAQVLLNSTHATQQLSYVIQLGEKVLQDIEQTRSPKAVKQFVNVLNKIPKKQIHLYRIIHQLATVSTQTPAKTHEQIYAQIQHYKQHHLQQKHIHEYLLRKIKSPVFITHLPTQHIQSIISSNAQILTTNKSICATLKKHRIPHTYYPIEQTRLAIKQAKQVVLFSIALEQKPYVPVFDETVAILAKSQQVPVYLCTSSIQFHPRMEEYLPQVALQEQVCEKLDPSLITGVISEKGILCWDEFLAKTIKQFDAQVQSKENK
jgi:translation initiation factor 2B subunit (eIF-2B alpha/beta/delta family)